MTPTGEQHFLAAVHLMDVGPVVQAHAVRTRPQLAIRLPSRRASSLGDSGTGSRGLLPHLSRGFSDDIEAEETAFSDIPSALHHYFQKLVRLHKDQANHDRLLLLQSELLCMWSAVYNFWLRGMTHTIVLLQSYTTAWAVAVLA